MHAKVFSIETAIFLPKSPEGLHFSAFHYICTHYSGTSGVYEHNGLSAKSYALRVVATVPNTRERVILRGVFRVPDKEMCSVTIVNRVEVKRDKAKVDFVGSDSVKEFFCRVDRTKRVECENLLCFI